MRLECLVTRVDLVGVFQLVRQPGAAGGPHSEAHRNAPAAPRKKLRHMLRSRPIYALRFEGTRYDAGDKLGFLKATVEYALRRHDLGAKFREYLKGLKL